MNKKLSIVLNIVKYFLLFIVLLLSLTYIYGFFNNNYKTLEEKHENSKILLNAELSGWVDTDYAETVSKLQRTEIAFQSAMTIHTKMFNQSLIEYL